MIYIWAIQYYSNYEREDRYRYVEHVFGEVIAELDPHYIDPYWMGALIITIEAQDLWEVVEPERHEWTLDELADVYFAGEPGPHGAAALARALEDSSAFHRRGKTFVPVKRQRLSQLREQERHATPDGRASSGRRHPRRGRDGGGE